VSRTQRFLLWIARGVADYYGYRVVRATPANLLPSRVEALKQRIRHLGHRFHVRRGLEREVGELDSLVERL